MRPCLTPVSQRLHSARHPRAYPPGLKFSAGPGLQYRWVLGTRGSPELATLVKDESPMVTFVISDTTYGEFSFSYAHHSEGKIRFGQYQEQQHHLPFAGTSLMPKVGSRHLVILRRLRLFLDFSGKQLVANGDNVALEQGARIDTAPKAEPPRASVEPVVSANLVAGFYSHGQLFARSPWVHPSSIVIHITSSKAARVVTIVECCIVSVTMIRIILVHLGAGTNARHDCIGSSVECGDPF